MSIAYDRCGDVICVRVRGFWCRQPCVVCGGKTDGRTHIIAGEFHWQRCCPVHGDAVLQHQERCGRGERAKVTASPACGDGKRAAASQPEVP